MNIILGTNWVKRILFNRKRCIRLDWKRLIQSCFLLGIPILRESCLQGSHDAIKHFNDEDNKNNSFKKRNL
jgi:hypothetical protein